MSTTGTSPEDFEKLAYKPIVSPAFGSVFAAPASWRKGDDPRYFQVLDPDSGAEFTASAYAANGLFLEQWATLRNSVVAQEMPYLKSLLSG